MNKPEEKTQDSGIAAQAGVYAASVGAGLLSMWAAIRQSFGRKIRNAEWYKALSQARNEKFLEIDHLKGKDNFQAYVKVKDDFTKIVAEAVKEKGFTNSVRKFQTLNKSEKIKVFSIAVTVATTAVGAITLIRQNRRIARQLEAMQREQESHASPGVNV